MLSPSSARRSRSLVAAGLAFAGSTFAAWHSRAAEGVVTTSEIAIRSAPFEVAPTLARAHAGDRLIADDRAEGGWRRVQLPDGRFGYLHDAEIAISASAPVPPAASPVAPPPPAGAASPVALQPSPVAAQPASEPASQLTLLGVMFELLPVGTLSATVSSPGGASGADASVDTFFAVAVAPFVDVPVSPYFTFGISPQAVFRVKGNGGPGQSATELDFRGRVTGRLPMSPNVRVFGRISPAFSIISLPAAPPGAMAPTIPRVFSSMLPSARRSPSCPSSSSWSTSAIRRDSSRAPRPTAAASTEPAISTSASAWPSGSSSPG